MPPVLSAARSVVAALALSVSAAGAEVRVGASLAGHAVLPAATFDAPPADAPAETALSGRFLDPAARVDTPASVPSRTGLATPFEGQPVQGISGFAATRDAQGRVVALIDNGFGAKANSPDALLSFLRLAPDFASGTVAVAERVWLRDPDRIVPFRIVHEATRARYLTGADFDPEAIAVLGDTLWIGDEFGPFLISATQDGRITGVYPARLDGAELRSPDHPALRVGAEAGRDYTVPRSGGFEGLAATPEGRLLAMLERPLIGADAVRVLEFDAAARAWTGRTYRFALTEGARAIGDLTLLDATRGLVIERDNGAGDPARACAPGAGGQGAESGTPRDCFPRPARVKRITLVDFGRTDPAGHVARLRAIDLMDIADPEGRARLAPDAAPPPGRFTFPFVTIESVMRDGPAHILVANDNNLPFSSGRHPARPDATEIVRLHVPDLLAP